MTLIAPTLQAFFTDRLITERNASPETIASYRDTMRLLVGYAHDHIGKAPHELDFDDLDAPLLGAFLTHLETVRGNTVRTRNTRLAAIHSLYRYAALRHPEHARTIARVIAIPPSAIGTKTSPTSTWPRSRRCLPHRTRAAGWADATTRYCSP